MKIKNDHHLSFHMCVCIYIIATWKQAKHNSCSLINAVVGIIKDWSGLMEPYMLHMERVDGDAYALIVTG